MAQLGDGLVGLPADARTREQLEWIADEVREAAGTAAIWLARPATSGQERELAEAMAAARSGEYREVCAAAQAACVLPEHDRARIVRQLRAHLHRIRRRDFFPPAERDAAVAAVDELAAGLASESLRESDQRSGSRP